MFISHGLEAQESKFLQDAINALRAGDCQKASDNYEMAKKLDGINDADIEKGIKLCLDNKDNNVDYYKDSTFTCDYLDYYFYMPDQSLSYDRAIMATKKSKFGNRSDWRIPKIEELQMIIDYHCLNYSFFPKNVMNKYYWSSSESSSYYMKIYAHRTISERQYSNIDNKCYCVFVRNNKGKKKK